MNAVNDFRSSAIGLGCWAIGGPFFRGTEPLGWGEVDDDESVRAIHRALELGVTFFDTSDFYGCGRSERVLASALRDRHDVVITTKFGYRCDEATRQVLGHRDLPRELSTALDASLARLQRDHVDLYLLHLRDFPLERVDDLVAALETEVAKGRIRGYGWSTDDPLRARAIARGEHCVAIEQALNVFQGDRDLLRFTQERGLLSIARSPLAMGLLAGRTTRAGADDIRSRIADSNPSWRAIHDRLETLRTVLTRDGRTLAQGALLALLSRGENVIPIPGFRSVAQVEENAVVLRMPAMDPKDVARIDELVASLTLPPDPLTLRG